MGWYKVMIDDSELLTGKHLRLFDEFLNLSMRIGRPNDLALFSKYMIPNKNNDFCFYFPPGSADYAKSIIKTYGGVTCEKPSKEQIVLLAGQESALDTYFPDE